METQLRDFWGIRGRSSFRSHVNLAKVRTFFRGHIRKFSHQNSTAADDGEKRRRQNRDRVVGKSWAQGRRRSRQLDLSRCSRLSSGRLVNRHGPAKSRLTRAAFLLGWVSDWLPVIYCSTLHQIYAKCKNSSFSKSPKPFYVLVSVIPPFFSRLGFNRSLRQSEVPRT
jgi:hypothetical protein